MEDEEGYDGPDAYLTGDGDDDELDIEFQEQAAAEAAEGAALDEVDESTVQGVLGALFELQGGRSESNGGNGNVQTTNVSGFTIRDLSRILGGRYGGLGAIRLLDDEDAEELESDEDYISHESANTSWFPEVKEPQEAGLKLLTSGEFGRIGNRFKSSHGQKHFNIYRAIKDRATSLRPPSREELAGDLIPNSNGTAVARYSSNAYSGQFSDDSSFYYTCVQDFTLNVYDMTAPPNRPTPNRVPSTRRRHHTADSNDDHQTTMKVINSIQGNPGSWTITDSHLSPDNERRQHIWGFGSERFGIWSCRFSADGTEVVAGGDGKIFVYDLKANRRSVKIEAHQDDVNSCCWADSASGNILISASDDTFIKVWDRRSLGSSYKPSGVLVGHTEGITSVSPKGDGRYVISNGKDQALRLWDLRKMRSNEDFERYADKNYGIPQYDYRYGHYPKPRRLAHPHDCSVMTYRGHAVLKTLIRCHFSPAETTGSQYIYSGSADGRIHVWSLDGRVVQILDRAHTLPMAFDPSDKELPISASAYRDRTCVRDVSWHSKEPVMMSVGWNGGRGSIVARHEWKGLTKMGNNLEDWSEKQKLERDERARRRSERFSIPDNSLDSHGFPPGFFVIISLATGRLLDVTASAVDDSTELILYPEQEKSLVDSLRNPVHDNQVFCIDPSGALSSRSSGHAIDVEDGRLVLRHRRPIIHPFPNAYSHPLPQFSYSSETKEISVAFDMDPSYPPPTAPQTRASVTEAWRHQRYILSSIPERRPKTFIDDASAFLTSAISTPFSFLSGSRNMQSNPEEIFGGELELHDDEILEQDRGEEGEVDDSLDPIRRVRVLGVTDESDKGLGEKATLRRKWEVIPLRETRKKVAMPRTASAGTKA
ncbi:WD40 repeat-like protein [Neolentinus lepideus HHB14362 ss-1]|uniref:WD40 repeat-like protein n=1 Tax=Neolentinus lepideus HHB14362 ss-1 TaxID=1314782 RepID=A0A165WAS4_9AGAM|nr:WD40 repeat-like protein [Neolentinus lepideus HHB14362 ss-1]